MSEDLLRKLRLLEEDYAGQPPVVQKLDLREINQIRSQLGMPLVDSRLNALAAAVVAEGVAQAAQPAARVVQDHTEARAIYQAYRKKIDELAVHQAYADEVARATGGPGQTPVRPLATMGTAGGPLLCDQCGKPIVLEGGNFHGVTADVAWQQNPCDNWLSWILGGMVVEIQTNGTLRIYHGYPGRNDKQCCNVATREDGDARAAFESGKGEEKANMILAFLEHEFPDRTKEEHLDLLDKILATMYAYDPGIGVNRPSGESQASN